MKLNLALIFTLLILSAQLFAASQFQLKLDGQKISEDTLFNFFMGRNVSTIQEINLFKKENKNPHSYWWTEKNNVGNYYLTSGLMIKKKPTFLIIKKKR